MIIRWPGITAARVDDGLYYQLDVTPTITELASGECSRLWDGRSFADAFRRGESAGRDDLVLGQCVWAAQRSVRFEEWIMIRTYHDGLKDFPPYMLFDLDADPHETTNLVEQRPELVARGTRILEDWHSRMMASSTTDVDPLWTVMHEGPYHANWRHLRDYCKRLRETGRAHHADALEARYRRTT